MIVLLCLVLLAGNSGAGVPRLMNYQGVLAGADGIPASGSHEMTFRIYGSEEETAEALWEETHVSVEVRDGVFSVVLGSAVPIPDDVLSAGELWLGVTIGTESEMSPRTRITPVPWALRAGVADVALRISEESHPPGDLSILDLGTPGVINDPENPVDWTRLKGVPNWIAGGTYDPEDLIPDDPYPVTDGKCKKWGDHNSLDAQDCDPEDVVYVDAEGKVGIGTVSPEFKVEFVEGDMTAYFAHHEVPYPGDNAYTGLRADNGEATFGCLGRILRQYDGDICYGVMGAAMGRAIENVGVYGIARGGLLGNYAGVFAGDTYVRDGKLTVSTQSPDGAIVELRSTLNDPVASYGKINFLSLYENVNGAIELYGPGNPHGNGFYFRTGMENDTRMVITNSGRVGIGMDEPDGKLVVAGDGTSWSEGFVFIGNDYGDAGIRLRTGTTTRHHIYNYADRQSTLRIAPNGDFATGGISIRQNGNVGIGNVTPAERLTVNGNAQIAGNLALGSANKSRRLVVRGNILIESQGTAEPVLELGEGLDYAEGFDVSAAVEIEPGAVLSIDPDNPGMLALSDSPYDTKVAGIVAGGRGLGSGVRLGVGQFDYDVALAGRVYCNVVAEGEAIEPGDLLTTSEVPGYAMRVADRIAAQGAILGKAMETLEAGEKGQILVLVTLQ
jgi:hypothetical protein